MNLEMTDLIAHTEMIDHDEFIHLHAGEGPFPTTTDAWYVLARELDYDLVWNIKESPMYGRYTDMGHAVWNENESYNDTVGCPFHDEEDVLSFDPVKECGLMNHEDMVREFQANIDHIRKICPDTAVPGGRYHSIFTACIRAFGWEMFLCSVPADENRFAKILEGFAEISIAEAKAWAKTDADFYITHDDIVWGNGPVFAPEWYRKYIFPLYPKIWEPLHEAGKKVIFCADGDMNAFIDDIADAGADGFLYEPCTDLETLTRKYGQTKIIIGNADCRVLQFGTREDIFNEVKRCTDLGRSCPGYVMLASNHIPNNISLDNINYYLEAFEKLRIR